MKTSTRLGLKAIGLKAIGLKAIGLKAIGLMVAYRYDMLMCRLIIRDPEFTRWSRRFWAVKINAARRAGCAAYWAEQDIEAKARKASR